jgi:hypothetical protein
VGVSIADALGLEEEEEEEEASGEEEVDAQAGVSVVADGSSAGSLQSCILLCCSQPDFAIV